MDLLIAAELKLTADQLELMPAVLRSACETRQNPCRAAEESGRRAALEYQGWLVKESASAEVLRQSLTVEQRACADRLGSSFEDRRDYAGQPGSLRQVFGM